MCKIAGMDFVYNQSNVFKQSVVILTLANDKKKLPGGRLNKKDGLTRYGDSHVKDKTS